VYKKTKAINKKPPKFRWAFSTSISKLGFKFI